MMKKIQLTYLINSMAMGGAESLLWDVINRLDTAIFSCSIVYLFGNNEFGRAANIRMTTLNLNVERIYSLASFKEIWNYFHRNPCEILHTHLCYADLYGQLVGSTQNIPLLYTTIHSSVGWPRERLTKLAIAEDIMLRRCTHVLAVSEHLRQFVINRRHCTEEKVMTLYNGLELGKFAEAYRYRETMRGELGIKKTDVLILCTAQFRPEKHHDLILEAFVKLLLPVPTAKLLLVGSGGANKNQIRQWIQDHGLQEKIIIRAATREEVPRYCGAADIFTSHSEHEGFGLALLEGMAAGLPFVIPSLPSFMEFAYDGVDGYMFPFGDSEMHAQKMVDLWNDIQHNNRFWLSTAKRVQNQFSIDTHIERLTSLYLSDHEMRVRKRKIDISDEFSA